MKIAFLSIYNGLIQRGTEIFTDNLAEGLAKHHEVFLYQGGFSNDGKKYKTIVLKPKYKSDYDSSYSPLRRLYLDWWSLQILIFSLRIIPDIFKTRPDVIIPCNGGWQVVIFKILSVILRKKLIVIGHAGMGRDDKWNLFWKPDYFVALTQKARDWAQKLQKRVKIVHIPNGIDLKQFSPYGSKKKILINKPLIICVSALLPSKRIDLTIEAVSLLRGVSLLVIGEGFQKDYLRDLGERLLGSERFMLLSLPHEQIASFYRSANVFTLVSVVGEAFGNVYPEALACNLPVVATDDATRREIIAKAGFFIQDPTDKSGYASILDRAIKQKFGTAPYQQALKFSQENTLNKYEELFNSL